MIPQAPTLSSAMTATQRAVMVAAAPAISNLLHTLACRTIRQYARSSAATADSTKQPDKQRPVTISILPPETDATPHAKSRSGGNAPTWSTSYLHATYVMDYI
jgi:hypothetical protein